MACNFGQFQAFLFDNDYYLLNLNIYGTTVWENIMLIETQGSEAINAMITLRQCWYANEEIYINKGCLHCGSAATYLIYFTNRKIQKLMLDFIAKYNCNHPKRVDLMDLEHFEQDYEQLLSQLEAQVIHYSFSQHNQPKRIAFEQVESIFERDFAMAC